MGTLCTSSICSSRGNLEEEGMYLGLNELREYREKFSDAKGSQVSPRCLSSPSTYFEGTNERYSTHCETWDDNPEETPLP